ncbi:hypothetical protein M1D52_10655 [Olivibacter sp. SA151]|uniref:hypothetical protein n=1 Tax=Olivibacter jilunii TaxID=985016 RepID=UPI003F1366CD
MNIKKITGTVLMAAMLSGSGIALAKTASKKAVSALQTEHNWIYNSGDPTEASSYTRTNEDLADVCESGANMCGIKAPESSNPNQPLISAQLEAEILSGQETDNVFRQP